MSGGRHAMRLDQMKGHFPTAVPKDKKYTARCQLHSLANKVINGTSKNTKGMRLNVLECDDCNARLCLNCWQIWHTKEKFEKKDYRKILRKGN